MVSYNVLARWLDEDVTTRLTELTDGLHGYLRFDGDAPTVEYNTNDSDQASFVHEATRYYQVYDSATGRLLVQSPDIAPLGLSLTRGEIVLLLATSQPSDITTPYGRLRIVNSPIAGPGGRTYLLQVGVSLRTLDASLSRYRDLLLVLTPLSLLLAAAGAWWLSGFALAPLTRAAFAARDIDVATLERRLPTRGVKDELEDVTLAFNETLGRLEQSIGEMRQFSTALAHELRTPLAALRGEIELALRATRDRRSSAVAREPDRRHRSADATHRARADAGARGVGSDSVDVWRRRSRRAGQLAGRTARAGGQRAHDRAALRAGSGGCGAR